MKRIPIFVILAAAFILLAMGTVLAQTAQSPLPKPTAYVNDYVGVITVRPNSD